MLQIKLRSTGGPSAKVGGGAKLSPGETVTVACPDHLVIADLPVAKSLGSVTISSVVKTVGRKSRRQLGERVHFCVRCDFPIAIYGRLSPCEHAFCLDCARSDSLCYLCDERIQKIQTIKMTEGILICAAPHCLKSFLKKDEFETHIRTTHGDLLRPNTRKEEGNESEAASARKFTTSDSTVQAPPRSGFSPSSSSQNYEREDRARHQQPKDQPPPRAGTQTKLEPPFLSQPPNYSSETFPDNNRPQGFDRHDSCDQFPQPNVDPQGRRQQESGQFQDKQHIVLPETPIADYVMQFHQPPNIAAPMNPNLVLNPSQFSYPQFAPDGVPFYGSPFQTRKDSAPEAEPQQGSVLGFPPGPAAGAVNFSGSYPQPWSVGPTGAPFDPSPTGQGNMDGFKNMSLSDTRGRVAFFQGNFEQNPGVLPLSLAPLPTSNKEMEQVLGQNAMERRDGIGILAPQPLPLPPPPPSHSLQLNQGNFFSGGTSHDAQGSGWQPEQH